METEKVMQLVVTQDEPDVAKLTIYGDITDGSFFALLLTKKTRLRQAALISSRHCRSFPTM